MNDSTHFVIASGIEAGYAFSRRAPRSARAAARTGRCPYRSRCASSSQLQVQRAAGAGPPSRRPPDSAPPSLTRQIDRPAARIRTGRRRAARKRWWREAAADQYGGRLQRQLGGDVTCRPTSRRRRGGCCPRQTARHRTTMAAAPPGVLPAGGEGGGTFGAEGKGGERRWGRF